MVRMTDLLKKAREKLGAKKELSRAEKNKSLPPEEKPPIAREESEKKEPIRPSAPKEESALEKEAPQKKHVEFSSLLSKGAKEPQKGDVTHRFMEASVPDEKETSELYLEAIEFAKEMFNIYRRNGEINRDELMNINYKILNNVISGPQEMLKLFHEMDSEKFYREYNALNVSILSVEIGFAYNYNKTILLELAIVGLVHDMDLAKNKEILDKPGKLLREEFELMKAHPLNMAAFADNAFNFKDDMAKAILQHHERRSGDGYPAGLTERDIHNLAEIIGIADTYEAMIHSRPYKEKMIPSEAILNIVRHGKKLFSNEVIKAMIGRVGMYPVSSWVELNTGERGKVLMTNLELPLRPVVGLIVDKARNKFDEIRTVDLQKIPSLYIKKAVDKIDV